MPHTARRSVTDSAPAPSTLVEEIKPHLRGWLHAGAAPLTLILGIILICLAPGPAGKVTSTIYVLTALSLFTMSAVYHRGNWTPKVKRVLKRLDHTNIMLVIAGSYTPLAWFLLPRQHAEWLLIGVWTGAVLGVLFRLFWTDAPRWLYTPVYVLLGLASVIFMGEFFAASVPAATLICVGGALYITGAVFYAIKRPNFSPQWFGFHELFHAFTIGAFTCHAIAIFIAVLGAR
ncbi:PAQR family membrane homeostasis protein TrhA [Galactobacter caseinivorans]|uniref:Hemolysin III family protein n=1 Tax=Galactobacter caseinivorans TaxID=2676123 RepID=A0A496PJH9_9MICC|nr:hemolysin III family protein [Galactobacter caseinivorans]RKW70608.1 hemolysin III family protein [Galactobacter caseinivorans]